MANGRGPSLELCDPDANNTLASNWRHAIEYQAKTPAGDSLWASPLAGCSYLPVADFMVSDSTIIIGQSVTFTDASVGQIDSWTWEFERGIPETFNGQEPPPITYNILGSYDVKLTVQNNAGKSIKYKPAFIQVGPAGIPDASVKDGFTVAPNPASDGRFSIRFRNAGEHGIKVFSQVGTVVEKRFTGAKDVFFALHELTGGLYFIQVIDQVTGSVRTQKLIIQ